MVKILFSQNLLTHPKPDAFVDESDAIALQVSSGFLYLVSTVSDNSKPWLALTVKFCRLWCQVRAMLMSVSLADRMSASSLICYFASHPVAFGY